LTDRYTADTAARISSELNEPEWLRARRMDAFDRYAALPWPDQTYEEWRHTDIRKLDLERFDPTPRVHAPVSGLDELPDEVRALAIGEKGDRLGLVVRMNARPVHLRLAPPLAEKGVVFGPIETVANERPELIEPYLGREAPSEFEAKLHDLNAAFCGSGSFLYVPRGVHVELPVQVVRWIADGGAAIMPRLVIVAGEASHITYIDYFGASQSLDAEALCNYSVEIYAEQGATVNYLGVQDWPQNVWHFSRLRASIGRDATVRTLAATLGGGLSRSVAQAVLDGQGSHAEMLGIYFGDRAQHVDNRTLQLHRGPNTSSEVYYKGALKGSSRAVYSGLVDIEKDAAQSDAQQANRNLLLSKHASADPAPFLEIKTSEVARATHGVSVGRPDENVLFYLRSRGIPDDEAQSLYVKGFFQEVIDRVRVPQIREALESAVEAELELEDE
jgi:Fe-S cluster assembly protein SufD